MVVVVVVVVVVGVVGVVVSVVVMPPGRLVVLGGRLATGSNCDRCQSETAALALAYHSAFGVLGYGLRRQAAGAGSVRRRPRRRTCRRRRPRGRQMLYTLEHTLIHFFPINVVSMPTTSQLYC